MRTLRYGLVLVFLAVASVLLLRTVERRSERDTTRERLARIVGDRPATIDLDHLRGASAADIYQLGNEYLIMWRVRDAAAILERAVAADSTYHEAWLKLIECYANPILGNERGLAHAASRAADMVRAPADTVLVSGLQALYVEEDYARAVTLLSRAVRESRAGTDAQMHLALAYYRLGHVTEALKQVSPLMKEDATVGRVAELSIKCRAAAGQWDHAAREASELVRLYPDEPMPLVLLAQVELARERTTPALESAGHALELDPYCVPAIIVRFSSRPASREK